MPGPHLLLHSDHSPTSQLSGQSQKDRGRVGGKKIKSSSEYITKDVVTYLAMTFLRQSLSQLHVFILTTIIVCGQLTPVYEGHYKACALVPTGDHKGEKQNKAICAAQVQMFLLVLFELKFHFGHPLRLQAIPNRNIYISD